MLGLTSEEARTKLDEFGPNELPEKEGESFGLIFLRQFKSPFIYMLFIAAIVAYFLHHSVNSVFIFAVLLINASVGAIQEHSAQRAAKALQKMVPQYASVYRDGDIQKLHAAAIVPGDVVLLASGDKVPADMELKKSRELLVDESILTGESLAANKNARATSGEFTPLSEQKNRVFAGTIVTHGRAQGEVIATGLKSQIGRIATEVTLSEATRPPLLERIHRFTMQVSYSVMAVIGLLFIIALVRGSDLTSLFLLGVGLAVSAIPEGLPAALTIALAISMRRMARANVIIRKPVAVESLGSCTYIASAKTGTLTVNDMTIKKIVLPDNQSFSISGEGIDPHGEITNDCGDNHSLASLQQLILTGLFASEAKLSLTERDTRGRLRCNGDHVDLAFLILAEKYGLDHEKTREAHLQIAEIPYESENTFSASFNRVEGDHRVFVKGSCERILPMCADGNSGVIPDKDRIYAQMHTLAGQGYRVLALATGVLAKDRVANRDALRNLTFLGLVGMIDPLRPEVKQAIEQCRSAQVDVAMITGDHPETALAIARELGIARKHEPVVTGEDLEQAHKRGVDTLAEVVRSSHVFARVEPTQKLQIARQLIRDGHNVAVTGDGVNDAPALHHAHVGISMGKKGTDVARESSDIILTDDNFASIVRGIKQGRMVYNNIRKVVFLLISTGAAEIVLFILSVLFSMPLPLHPIQLLWLNLVTNGIQDVALAFEPAEGNEMARKPRPPDESIFNRIMLERVLINALAMGCLAFATFAYFIHLGHSETSARNITLLLMVLFENVHLLNSRSETLSIFKQAFFSNPLLTFGMLAAQAVHIGATFTPGLKDILEVQPVSPELWCSLLLVALLLIVVNELYKARRSNHTPPDKVLEERQT